MTAFGIERDLVQDVGRMADLVMSAAAPRSNGNTGRASRVVHGIVADLHGEYDRAALGWAVTSILHERIGLAWERNWQPVDLERLVARRHKEPVRELLADAVAEHLQQYAKSTLDPELQSQMSAMGATVWWDSEESYPLARGRRHRDWHLLVTSAVELIATLWAVPQIEKIGAAPGERHYRTAPAPDVEPRILERVRRLLAKAESTTFEAEAETFTAGAQSLMARHSIDAALAASEHTTDGPAMRRIGVSNPYESPKVNLLNGIATVNRARAIWSKDLGFVTVIGHHEDLDAVETLFTSLLVQATSSMTRQGSRTDEYGRSRTAAFRRSFLTAFAVRIGERLQDAADAEVTKVAEAVEGGSGAGSGQALVTFLDQRRAAVDDLAEEQFPHLRKQRPTVVSDGEGWFSGQAAADRASLGSGAQVVGGAD